MLQKGKQDEKKRKKNEKNEKKKEFTSSDDGVSSRLNFRQLSCKSKIRKFHISVCRQHCKEKKN
jgi:hypothetical protein